MKLSLCLSLCQRAFGVVVTLAVAACISLPISAEVVPPKEKNDPPPKAAAKQPEKNEKEEVTFSVVGERKKRFDLFYESKLEKTEPVESVMCELREALGRVETRLGKFEEKFRVVVMKKFSGTEAPYVTTGKLDDVKCIYVTYNGSTEEVFGHGLGMLRIEELNPKTEVWLKIGGARVLTTGNGFDGEMYKTLDKAGGPASYADAKKWLQGKGDKDEQRQAQATGWLLMYYLTEVASERKVMRDVLDTAVGKLPDPETVWEAVQKHVKKKED